ncbi:MAG: hypothetical protein ACHQ01_10405 [Candidatus Limnocylindrales bacterium]
MSMSPYPAITGNAVLRALAPADADAAGHMDAAAEQAALDEQEIRDLERAEYYDGPSELQRPATSPEPRVRGVRGLVIRLTRSLRRRG